MTKHNKKRNVGLIHEQLVRYVASSMIAGDKKEVEKTIAIIEKHFKKGSELYREFRLFNSLLNFTVDNESLAERILNESKSAAKTHNATKLSHEKSLLIKDINENLLQSRRFYDIQVEQYKMFATVQTLLNEWRGNLDLDPVKKAIFENSLIQKMLLKKIDDVIAHDLNEQCDPLVRKLMFQKFNEKYKNSMSEAQRSVLECAILGSDEDFKNHMISIKENALCALQKLKSDSDNETILENIENISKKISLLNESKNDESISKTLQVMQLISEIESHEWK